MKKADINQLFELLKKLEQTPAHPDQIGLALGVSLRSQRKKKSDLIFVVPKETSHPFFKTIQARTGPLSLDLVLKESFHISAAFYFYGRESELTYGSDRSGPLSREFKRPFGRIRFEISESNPNQVTAIYLTWGAAEEQWTMEDA